MSKVEFQDINRQQNLYRAISPSGHYFTRHACRISNTREKDICVQNYTQCGHDDSTLWCARQCPLKFNSSINFSNPVFLRYV